MKHMNTKKEAESSGHMNLGYVKKPAINQTEDRHLPRGHILVPEDEGSGWQERDRERGTKKNKPKKT